MSFSGSHATSPSTRWPTRGPVRLDPWAWRSLPELGPGDVDLGPGAEAPGAGSALLSLVFGGKVPLFMVVVGKHVFYIFAYFALPTSTKCCCPSK